MLPASTVAQQLGLSTRAVYELHAAGLLPGYRLGAGGRALRFDPADVEAYRASCRSTAIRQAAAGSLTSTAVSPQRPGHPPGAGPAERAGSPAPHRSQGLSFAATRRPSCVNRCS
jgi:excisionase family DNA binding protein